jgi:hypothetical protein
MGVTDKHCRSPAVLPLGAAGVAWRRWMKRPIAITIICWILIVTGALGVAGSVMVITSHDERLLQAMAQSPIPIPVQYCMLIGGTVATVVSGIGMLWGKNWARLLYVIWSGIGLVIGLITSPAKMNMIPGGAMYLIVAFLLFQPNCSEYFSPKSQT